MAHLLVIGGGLAGCEAAWQAAERGISVLLYEMRPKISTGAHVSDKLAELVCSNSMGSKIIDRAPGLLKEEIRRLGSLLLECAEETALPAGGALAVDRNAFSERVTARIQSHPNIRVVREEVRQIPETPTIISSGPLTSEALSNAIIQLTGEEHLFFYDAIAPVIFAESIDMSIAFSASRYDLGDQVQGDYINCPLERDEYEEFVDALIAAERIGLRDFERDVEGGVRAGIHTFFEGCLPIEILARRGREAPAFGPMRPVGLVNPRTGNRPYAVVQLRRDNHAGSLYNLVGFQTNLKFSAQKSVFRKIPGLQEAEFARFGQMHRNTFIFSPALLRPTLQYRSRDDLFFAGQITGVEGYCGNIATGLLAGINASQVMLGKSPVVMPLTTMLGGLCHYISHASPVDFQPMKANFGLLPPVANGRFRKNKQMRFKAYSERALSDLDGMIGSMELVVVVPCPFVVDETNKPKSVDVNLH